MRHDFIHYVSLTKNLILTIKQIHFIDLLLFSLPHGNSHQLTTNFAEMVNQASRIQLLVTANVLLSQISPEWNVHLQTKLRVLVLAHQNN